MKPYWQTGGIHQSICMENVIYLENRQRKTKQMNKNVSKRDFMIVIEL